MLAKLWARKGMMGGLNQVHVTEQCNQQQSCTISHPAGLIGLCCLINDDRIGNNHGGVSHPLYGISSRNLTIQQTEVMQDETLARVQIQELYQFRIRNYGKGSETPC